MQQVAQTWLLYDLTGSALLVGLNGLLRTVPFLAMSLYAGSIVDRTDRRRLLLMVECVQGVLTLLLGVLVAGGHVQVWHIYAFSIITALFGAFEIPAQQSLLPYVVPRQDLLTAVGLNSMVRRGTQIIGPSLGGVFIAAFGVAETYFLNCLGYLALITALCLMRATNPVSDRAHEPPLDAIVAGLRYVRADVVMGTLLAVEALFSLFGSFNPLLVVLARDVFRVGPEGFGILQSAPGIGTVLGAIGLGVVGDVRAKGRLMIGAGVVYGVAVIAFANCPWFPLAVVLLAISGAADFIRGTTRTTTLQLRATGAMLGRVMSLDGMSTRGLGQLGGFEAGTLASWIGVQWALIVNASVCLAAILGVAWRVPEIRELAPATREVESEPRAADGPRRRGAEQVESVPAASSEPRPS